MTYDCFTFNDELDLLELRLEILSPVVDKFVIAELPVNFRQQPKPMHLAENLGRYEKWADKIVRVSADAWPNLPHPAIEHFQRRLLSLGLGLAEAGDTLLIGDVDEIPAPWVIRAFHADHPMTMVQDLYYYHVNRRVDCEWPGTVILPRGCVKEIDCEAIRENRFHFPLIGNGGWHFSWLGSADQIANKLRCIDVQRDAAMHGSADIRCPDPNDAAWLETCRETGADLFGRPMTHALVPIEPGITHPYQIEAWLAKYPHYAIKEVMV